MASSSFRDSMNSLGWSRRDDLPATTSSTTPILSKLQSFNPFSSGGYVSLPTDENPGAPLPARSRREEEEAWLARKCSLIHMPAKHNNSYVLVEIYIIRGFLTNNRPTVSRWDRILVFGGLNLAALGLFAVCFTLFPILSLRPRKFAIL